MNGRPRAATAQGARAPALLETAAATRPRRSAPASYSAPEHASDSEVDSTSDRASPASSSSRALQLSSQPPASANLNSPGFKHMGPRCYGWLPTKRRERRRVLIYSGAVKSVNTCDHRKVHLNVCILICGGRIGLQYEPGALLGPLGGIL